MSMQDRPALLVRFQAGLGGCRHQMSSAGFPMACLLPRGPSLLQRAMVLKVQYASVQVEGGEAGGQSKLH